MLPWGRRPGPELIEQRKRLALTTMRWVPCDRKAGADQEPVQADAKNNGASGGEPSVPTNGSMPQKEELDWLFSVARDPFKPSTARDKKLGFSSWKGPEIRKRLQGKGLIQLHVIEGVRGGVKLSELTEQGEMLLASMGVKIEKPRGRGSFAHKFWQHAAKGYYERKIRGCVARIESEESGKPVDVAVDLPNGKRVAVEISVTTSPGDELWNITADLGAGFDRIVIAASPQKWAKVSAALSGSGAGAVSFVNLKDLLGE